MARSTSDGLAEASTQSLPAGRATADSNRFAPGTMLSGRYRIVTVLGRGGMGEVYRADDLRLGQSVALKFLPEAMTDDEARLQRFLDEVRIAREISHPNICRVYDLVEVESLHFITMEFVDGEDLASLLRRIGRLPRAKAVELGLEICAGLDAMHERGVLHRDLKPANLMIDSAGRARITDFGLAGSVGAAGRGGTPAYMAPEQRAGGTLSVATDLYALGRVLYELFTGERPTEPWRRPQGLEPSIEGILRRCLAEDPGERPSSAREVAAALSSAEKSRPSQSAPVLRTLLVSDLVDSTKLVEELGDPAAGSLFERHDRLARDLLADTEGREIDKTDGFLLLFDRSWNAVRYALAYHEALRELSERLGRRIAARVGIHVGEVVLRENPSDDVQRGAKPLEVEGLAKPTAARLMSLALGGQTLLTRTAFDPARRAAVGSEVEEELRWLTHGHYRIQGVAEPLEVFEVGVEGRAPLRPPPSSEKVSRVSDTEEPLDAIKVWNVPFERNPFFTGRTDLLEKLRGTLTTKGTTALCGLGGIGKTQTAVEYAYRYRDHYDAVLWAPAETVDGLETGYVEIARQLDLAEKNARERRITVEAVLQWLEVHDSWLLILDNADTPEDLKGRLPAQRGGPGDRHVLLTSRARAFGRLARPLKIATLPPAEAEEFLRRRTYREETSGTEQEAVAELARELGYLPLALEQAGAYVEETGASFQAYLSGFRGRSLELLDEETAPEEHVPVTTAWEMNFAEIEKASEASTDLLRASAFLAPDAIPVELFAQGAPELGPILAAALENAREDELVLDEVLRPLRRYSLIQRDAEARTFSIHRLVQEAVKARMDEDTRKLWAERVVQAIARVLPNSTEEFQHHLYLHRTERLFSHCKAASQLVKRWTIRSPAASRLLRHLGCHASWGGVYGEAESFFREALTMSRQQGGDRQYDMIFSLFGLAVALEQKGAYENAESLYREALATAQVHRNTGPYSVACIQVALGRTMVFRGIFEEAEQLLRGAQSALSCESGDEDPIWVYTLYVLGYTSFLKGASLEEAEQLSRQAAKTSRRLNLPFWQACQSWWALALSFKGALNEGESLGREALTQLRRLRRELLGATSLDFGFNPVAINTLVFGIVLFYRQAYKESEQLCRDALAIYQRQFGDDHPLIGAAMSFLGLVLVVEGAHEEAESLFNNALTIQRQRLGEEHYEVASSLSRLAELRLAQRRHAEAEKLIRQTLEICRKTLPADSFWIATIEARLGAVLTEQQRYEEAESLLVPGYAVLKDKAGDRSPLTLLALDSLVTLYETWGQAEKGAEYRALSTSLDELEEKHNCSSRVLDVEAS